MWFRQLQIMQLPANIDYSTSSLMRRLEPLVFRSCPLAMFESMGWTNCIGEEEGAPLVHTLNDYSMLCMQIEEKILPRTVVRQELINQTKIIELREQRKVRGKEKINLEDEITRTLLPRAFTKLTRIYGYIDTKKRWLILGTTQAKRTQQFISLLKKSMTSDITMFETQSTSPILTDWLINKNYPTIFEINKKVVLQDKQDQNRVIRCQEQNLFANPIQSLLKENCVVKELSLTWQDRIHFTIKDGLQFTQLQYEDNLKGEFQVDSSATVLQKFNSDFFIMTQTLSQLLTSLLPLFSKASTLPNVSGL